MPHSSIASRIGWPMLDERSKYLRRLIIRALLGGGRGHVGPSFSLVEIMRVLYDDVITPRDKVILSKGHGCLALYAMLADKGIIDVSELDRFCREGAMLGGHPEHHIPGVHVSTGSLGHGLSLGIGFALADRTSRVFVILGDGECDEGSIWEAALCAGKHKLSNLTVIVDYNKRQSYGTVEEVQPLEPLHAKWDDFGFGVADSDGHDVEELRGVLGHIAESAEPLAFICHTVKGKGVPEVENHPLWHHKDTFTAEDAARLTAALEAE
jgi:transketolase